MIIEWNHYKRCNFRLWPFQLILSYRGIKKSPLLAARSGEVGNTKYKRKGKKSRQDRIDDLNMESHTKLYYIDNEFNIFNKDIKKVLDLGYVSGNWSEFAKYKLCQIHALEEDEFHKRCHILGFDLLFGSNIKGISTIQGNIYSKMSHQHITDHFKGLARMKDFDSETKNEYESYYSKESKVEDELHEIVDGMKELRLDYTIPLSNASTENLSLSSSTDLAGDYGPDLILSDLGTPFLQQHGFFNNTSTRPYTRFSSNGALQKPITDGPKASIDLADASLLLTCKLLKAGGIFVVRLQEVDLNDPELELYNRKLRKVFKSVSLWNKNGLGIGKPNTTPNIHELFFVCKEKKFDHEFNTNSIF